MTTRFPRFVAARRARLAATSALLIGGTLLASAGPAGAIPLGEGNPPPPPLNHPPTASFTVSPNPAVVNPIKIGPLTQVQALKVLGTLVKFDAAGSSDDKGIIKYEWDLDGNGTYETNGGLNPKTERHYSAAGNKTIRLRVTDTNGVSRTTARLLILHRAPTAKLAATPSPALVGQSIALSAAASTDDNGIAKYEFDRDGDGTFETDNGNSPTTSASFATLGERTLKVRVTDVFGASSIATKKVDVHRAPTASFTHAPATPTAGATVQFDASASSDDGAIADYAWDLDGDGTFETDSLASPQASKVYANPGTVQVRLRVTDDKGVQDVVSRAVTIDPAPPAAGGGQPEIDSVAPKMRLKKKALKMTRKGIVKLRVVCPNSETLCTGQVSLRKTKGARTSSVASKSFQIQGGKARTVKFKLGRADRKTVRNGGKLRLTAVSVATDAAGNLGSSSAKVTVKR